MSTPVLASVLGACGADGAHGFAFVRSPLLRRTADSADAELGAAAVNAFGADIYGAVAASEARNIVFSPASIMLAMAMTSAGARGTTSLEMYDVLHARATGAAGLHSAMNSLSAQMAERNRRVRIDDRFADVSLNVANSLWGQKGVEWNAEFLDLLATEYGAGMRTVDYAMRPEEARSAINGWVADETKDRIRQLIEPGVLTSDSRLTLVNAIYMKAPWIYRFDESATRVRRFRTFDGADVSVPFMENTESFGYASGDAWTAVELPYAGGELSMLVVLPDDGALPTVEARLGHGLFDEVATSLEPTFVSLSMPRFELESRLDLKDTLRSLGMQTAFQADSADFTGMTVDEKLFINFVVHQANISVDENGTEAAAATATGMAGTSAPTDVVEMRLDRPFVYAVRDVLTGAVLFLGRVGDPSGS